MAHVMIAAGDIGFLGKRGRTEIGPQGDHVTSHVLFEQFIKNLPRDDDPADCLYKIGMLLSRSKAMSEKYEDVFTDDISEAEKTAFANKKKSIDDALDDITKEIADVAPRIVDKSTLKAILGDMTNPDLKIIAENSIRLANESLFNKIEARAASIFLQIRNKLKYVTFPVEGSIPAASDEGGKNAAVIKKLHFFNDEKALAEGSAEFLAIIKQLFWYPKVPEAALFKLETPAAQEEWKKIVKTKKYNKPTLPRTNNLPTLYYVTAVHLDTVFSCLHGVHDKALIDTVTEQFVEEIGKDWGLTLEEKSLFLVRVKELREVDKKAVAEIDAVGLSHLLPTPLLPVSSVDMLLSTKGKPVSPGSPSLSPSSTYFPSAAGKSVSMGSPSVSSSSTPLPKKEKPEEAKEKPEEAEVVKTTKTKESHSSKPDDSGATTKKAKKK